MSALLTIAISVNSPQLLQQLRAALGGDRYVLKELESGDLLRLVSSRKSEIDCLVLEVDSDLLASITALRDQGTILPVVFLAGNTPPLPPPLYHSCEVTLSLDKVPSLEKSIDRAIADFLSLAPAAEQLSCPLPDLKSIAFLLQQQRRLAAKLKERLGYLAVYYNRNSEHFFRNLSATERATFSAQLKVQYHEIIMAYFSPDLNINDMLDQFVTLLFFADLSVSEVVELHMELMEEFSKQLKLEGWSEDVLLDYRLTLIDVIAHLCEMYRRSVPRERS